MAIPDYQKVMLPLLKLIANRKALRLRETYEQIADEFNLSSQERKELLPSGNVAVIRNRIAWAKLYLSKAGLVEAPQRGIVKITQRGLDFLAQDPQQIDISTLKQFPDFVQFLRKRSGDAASTEREDHEKQQQTPDELLEYAYQNLRNTLADDLISCVKDASPAFFEELVVDLLVGMGYGGSVEDAGRVIGRSGDGGIDGIIKEDRLGLDVIYIQAKRWDNVVGRPEIQKFVGALQGQRSKKGVFITTSKFTREAMDYAGSIDSNIVLIDGDRLAQLMIDFDIGVSKVDTYVTKHIDTDYFAEE